MYNAVKPVNVKRILKECTTSNFVFNSLQEVFQIFKPQELLKSTTISACDFLFLSLYKI